MTLVIPIINLLTKPPWPSKYGFYLPPLCRVPSISLQVLGCRVYGFGAEPPGEEGDPRCRIAADAPQASVRQNGGGKAPTLLARPPGLEKAKPWKVAESHGTSSVNGDHHRNGEDGFPEDGLVPHDGPEYLLTAE